MPESGPLFKSLVGEPMSAVSFVMDYIEFHFNGQVVRALSSPTLQRGSWTIAFPEPGSRDALCALIGDEVVGIDVVEDASLSLRFGSGAVLIVPLDVAHRVGPEALHFMRDGQFVVIW